MEKEIIFPEWLKKSLLSCTTMSDNEINLAQSVFNRFIYRYMIEECTRLFSSNDVLNTSYEKLVKIAQNRMSLMPLIEDYKKLGELNHD